MRIDPESVRSYYASISDEAMLDLYPDRAQLTEVAQKIFDEEMARRNLTPPAEEVLYGKYQAAEAESEARDEDEDGALEIEPPPDDADGPPPSWLEDAACAWGVAMRRTGGYGDAVASVRSALYDAGIPNHIVIQPPISAPPPPDYPECRVMVPVELGKQACSVVERNVFNAWQEAEFRSHLHSLTGEEFAALTPEEYWGALEDLIERKKRAYAEEAAARKAKK